MSSIKVPAGATHKLSNVPAGASIGVAPGSGGTMLVQYRISSNGPLRSWPDGTVGLDTDDVMHGPAYEVIFTATTADGLAEWNWPGSPS